MSNLLSKHEWQDYNSVLDNWSDTMFQHTITWLRRVVNIQRWGEDPKNPIETINLKCLPNYNIPRTWPVNQYTLSGILDEQSIQVFFNLNYLRKLGYLTNEGNFNYDPGFDKFRINGQTWKPSGDTLGDSVRYNEDLQNTIYVLVLQRDTKSTGTKPIP